MKNYSVIAISGGFQVAYVFAARSWHDAKMQAEAHGLFGDRIIRIERGDERVIFVEGDW